ncbi:AGE family epimerase/isomerase [Streptomonospora nanhaiensis]|uniref:Mannose/cellobiose epimerase-like protein (N-acyl-D-glucosamine 2-epimerase family) n=1 Tax=Streptomonospora nanhaiensis TaxID=1323731 RepID=A0A853BUL8_9ACTN|nr:AGE family epimerase/isomerase [Streptomonospora nanhaiensis]MBV2366741.1 AGE family epimerase/isomerase [Streptomonospora nanhaiensis]MBX9389488.1 AGE family epimerase/isomerase [Streptomonospora nanhaiensis]NYI98207.1 mannose/cellobiose epimerase-like protein (N-acyl-D-glucosamine 2-epimerase family) [Streptomonospora nanhaiensis]
MDPSADDPAPPEWTRAQRERLVAWAERARHPHGFAWLDDTGRPRAEEGVHTWITARAAHVGALHALHADGADGTGRRAAALAEHGVARLRESLRDPVHGGWFSRLDLDGTPADTGKAAYQHAFVLLAGATGTAAGIPGAAALLADAAAVVDSRFWDESAGRAAEAFDRDWTGAEPYRGANSNMHLVEAFLAAGAATGEPAWARRALGVAAFLIGEQAAGHGHRLPEHYTADWAVLPEYNRDRPADPFRPYGWTPGHSLEWARLLLHVEAALADPPEWLLPAAEALFATAARESWARDGADGFCYTLDWSNRPVIRARMHWVAAEAVAAATALHRRTGAPGYAGHADRWWRYVRAHLVDDAAGNWRHELDAGNRPAATVWAGRPDVYHAYTALAFAEGLAAPGFALRTAEGSGAR